MMALTQTVCTTRLPAPCSTAGLHSSRMPAMSRCTAACTWGQRAAAGGASGVAARAGGIDVSDEWQAVESLASADEVLTYYNHQHQPKNTRLHDVMQVNLVLTSPDASLAEASALMDGPPSIEGLPVVAADGKLVGVLSRKDFAKGGTHVKDVMSAPAVSLKASSLVSEAATLMVERKFHRVPVVDDAGACVGIVTRTDIFWALAATTDEGETHFNQMGIDV